MKKPLNYHGFAFDANMRRDKRQKRWAKQRAKRGFDDTEIWGLEYTMACFILPRLRAIAREPGGFPGGLTYEGWKAILGEMVVAFEMLAKDEEPPLMDHRKVTHGLKLFAKWYQHLWT